MTSPSTPGVFPPARAGGVRVAFYARVARDDDPHAAVQQQLRAVTAALPSETPIVGYFADVGPWNGLRGSKYATATPNLGGHPVDGGLIDLLDRARRPDRHFDVVACAAADRLSRRLVERVRIEDNLAAYGVRVVTADDPNIATPHLLDMHSTTQVRLRRWAWDVVTAETSHRSRDVSDRLRAEGWHIGPTPYGYVAETLTVARQRRRRLVVDPVPAGIVRTISPSACTRDSVPPRSPARSPQTPTSPASPSRTRVTLLARGAPLWCGRSWPTRSTPDTS